MPNLQDKHFKTDHLKRDVVTRAVRGGAVIGIGQVSKGLLSFVGAILVLPRLLTPAEFGMVGMVISVIGFVGMFRDLGLSHATVQRAEINHMQVSTLFWVNVSLGFGVMLVTVALAPVLSWFYGVPEVAGITLALSVAAVIGGLSIQHQALLRRQMRFNTLVIIEVTALCVELGATITLALGGFSYWSLIAGKLSSATVTAVGVWVACDWRPGLPSRKSGVRSMIVFGGNVTGFNVINYFARNLDDILIGRFAGTAALGLYQKAYDVLRAPLREINAPISRVAIPTLSRLIDEPDRYRQSYCRILEKILLLTVPLGTFFIATADWIIPILLGDHWAGASPLLMALGILLFIQPLGNTTGWLFISQDRTDEMLRWGFVGSSIAVISFIIGLPWGPFGVALSYSISGVLLGTPLLLWWVGRKGPVRTRDFYRTAFPFGLAALVSLLAVIGFRCLVEVSPAVGALLALLLTLVTTFFTLLLLRRGRAALKDVITIVRELRKRDSEESRERFGERLE